MRHNLERKPIISIAMLVYNHEKYLQQALDSVFRQKIGVLYEIVIGEDCSTDDSREVIKKWMEKYPDIIRLISHDHNLGMHENFNQVLFSCKGEYIAWLEGDDFWQDDYKLQKQYIFLERHSDYVGAACNVTVVDEVGNPNPIQQKNYPLQNESDFLLKDLKNGKMPGQTGTFFHRNIFREMDERTRKLVCDCNANGDTCIIGILALNGKIKIMPEVMSAYRFVTVGGSNWNSITHDKNYCEVYYNKILELEYLLSNLSGKKVSLNTSRYRQVASALLTAQRSHNREDINIFRTLMKKEKNKAGVLFYCGRLAVRHVLK